jgi:hypothetical protein
MNASICETMVEAGVTKKLMAPVMYDKYSNKTLGPDKFLGSPTRCTKYCGLILFCSKMSAAVKEVKQLMVMQVDSFLLQHQVSAHLEFWECLLIYTLQCFLSKN